MNTEVKRALDGRRALLARLARPAGDAPLRVFCSGIGGTGLSGLARLVSSLGHTVRGSDRAPSLLSRGLEAEGLAVTYTQEAANLLPGADLFVATAALPPTHPELVAAIQTGIPVVKYAEALGALVAARRGVAIAGTHGKTTTTSLTAHVLSACGRSPSYIVGGQPKDLPANAGAGEGPELVFEACEFDHSFRHYVPSVAVVLNVEEDHLDCYRDGLAEIVEAFVEFGALIREGGTLIVSADWPAALQVADHVREVRPDVAIETFSLGGAARYSAQDLRLEDGLARFELRVDGRPVCPVRLSIPGRHNAANALAAIAAAAQAGVDPARAAAAVEGFTGVRRRFDVLAQGDAIVVDDYAHHPTAIEAVIGAARARYPDRRVVVCFEPHQASRTRQLFEDFTRALASADRVLLADIYVCRDREEDIRAVSAADLAAAVRERAPRTQARHAGDLAAATRAARALIGPGDVALFLGAGRISAAAHQVADDLATARRPAPPRRARLRGAALTARLQRRLGGLLRRDEPLAPHCTLRAGGRARFFATPRTEAEAIEVVRTLAAAGVPTVPLGGGSNVLFAGERFDGAVLLTRRIRGAQVLGNTLRVAAGTSLQGVLRMAERFSLAGLETFAGVPGTLGGAVFGNAGGPKGGPTVGERVLRARVIGPDGRVTWRGPADLGLRYRGSALEGCLVLSVDLLLDPDDPERLRRVRLEATRRKAASQPLDARSAGCTFRNPPGESAGRLIDRLGLKGLRRGDARVSPVHANFIVNEGAASPTDILGLMEEVRGRVFAAHGVRLEPELRLIA